MGQRSSASMLLILLLLVLLVPAVGGIYWHFDREIEEVDSQVSENEDALAQAASERRRLKDEVGRILNMYDLIGSELDSTDEKFDDTLRNALRTEELEIEENRRNIAALRADTESRIEALLVQTTEIRSLLLELREQVGGLQADFREGEEELLSLHQEVVGLKGATSQQMTELTSEVNQQLAEMVKLTEEQDDRFKAIEAELESEVSPLQSELARLRRYLDETNHRLSRLESRLAEP